MSNEKRDLLIKFAKIIVYSRDDCYKDIIDDFFNRDHQLDFFGEAANESQERLKDFILYCIDRYIYKLMSGIQDSEVDYEFNLFLEDKEKIYKLNDISDGLLGDFMTDNGFISKLSSIGRNRIE